jgi:hypothetical protein
LENGELITPIRENLYINIIWHFRV